MRYLVGSVQDWNSLFEQAFRACKPGGWVESFEGVPIMQSDDGSVPDDSAMAGWGKTFIEAGKKLERSFTVVDDNVQEEGMAAAGLVDIESRIFKVGIHTLVWDTLTGLTVRYLLGDGPRTKTIETSACSRRRFWREMSRAMFFTWPISHGDGPRNK